MKAIRFASGGGTHTATRRQRSTPAVGGDGDAVRVLGNGPHRVSEADPARQPPGEAAGQFVRPLLQPEGLGRVQAAGRPDRPEIEEQPEHRRLARLDGRVPPDVHAGQIPSRLGAQVPADPVLGGQPVPLPGPAGPPGRLGRDGPGHQRHKRPAHQHFGQDRGRDRRKRGAAVSQAAAEFPDRAARHSGRHDMQAQLPDVPEHLPLAGTDPLRAQVEHERRRAAPVARPGRGVTGRAIGAVAGAGPDSTRPPTRSRASNTVTLAPEALRLTAVRSPASPAPTTAKSAWRPGSPFIALIHSLRRRAVRGRCAAAAPGRVRLG